MVSRQIVGGILCGQSMHSYRDINSLTYYVPVSVCCVLTDPTQLECIIHDVPPVMTALPSFPLCHRVPTLAWVLSWCTEIFVLGAENLLYLG